MCIFFADILVNGVAALAVGLVAYLGWLSFQQKREWRAEQKGTQTAPTKPLGL
jgi:hypothetical protein